MDEQEWLIMEEREPQSPQQEHKLIKSNNIRDYFTDEDHQEALGRAPNSPVRISQVITFN